MTFLIQPAFQLIDIKGPGQAIGFFFLVLFLVIYFLPSGVAGAKNSARSGLVFMINFFFGWSIIGWLIALSMAIASPSRKQIDRDGDTQMRNAA